MTAMLPLTSFIKVGKLCLMSGCLIGVMGGCSSKLQTMMMSGTEPSSNTQTTKLETQTAPAEEVVQTPVQDENIVGNPSMDIPVEEPARPVIPPSASGEIFATPRTDVEKQAVHTPHEAPLIAESEALPSSVTTAPVEKKESPPISIDPEMPALPAIAEATAPEESLPKEESGSASLHSQKKNAEPFEPALKQDDSIQIAKVVPSSVQPEAVESRKESTLKALEDVYFDYDRFTIRQDAVPVLEENAQTLVADLLDKNVVIEGHCDQRGTESYNMVLGKRRANAVKEFLVSLGVPSENLQVVSYGKEKPFCIGQNEQCWQENRRGHFILK